MEKTREEFEKEALKEIVRNYQQHLNYDKYPHCTIEWFANRAQYLAKQALKDGKNA